MDFNIEVNEFSSAIHESIYSRARRLMPLADHPAIAEPARESWKALHNFLMGMLSDMYDYPEKYNLPVGKLEKFLDGRDIHKAKRDSISKTKSMLVETKHAVSKYLNALKPSIYENHPEMRLAMDTISRCWYNIMYDYRDIAPKYKPTFDDFFAALFAEQRKTAYALHSFAMERKMRTGTNANWGVLYDYKGKHVMTIVTGGDMHIGLAVKIIGKGKKDDISALENALAKEPQAFQGQVLNHLSGCDANRCLHCSGYSSGRYVSILGKQHQMCGEGIISYDFYNPVSEHVAMIKHLINMRCEYIEL